MLGFLSDKNFETHSKIDLLNVNINPSSKRLIDSSKHDPKSLWKTLNEAINRKQSKNSSIDSILVNNLKISNPTEMGISIIQFLKHQYYLSSILKIIPIFVVLKKSMKLLNH